ncbi:24188_t:CDS:2 [Cetraspora pellucida]|uniref:24188_t:CDS:1 n=1 Tax=Cetraspora pellucida TaxID=1433469 RepID=A0A9N9DVP3_9GLOM|nr:24188_t:CDS:2 [Cetraspora pellucida]
MFTNIDYSHVFSLGNKSVDLYSIIMPFNSTIQSLENKANNLYSTTMLFNSTQSPENDAIDLTLEVDESQFFNSENEKENKTNSSQDDLNETSKAFLFGEAKKIVDITKQCKYHSTAIDCEWHVNFNNCKNTTKITCTSFVDKHNHEMDPIID